MEQWQVHHAQGAPLRARRCRSRMRPQRTAALPLLQQNALDGVPLCFMLRRFSRPNRARGEGPGILAASGGWNALLLRLEGFC